MFVYSPNIWCVCNVLESVVTPNIFLIFTVFLFIFLKMTLENDNMDNVSQELFVCHYDSPQMQDNWLYSLNKTTESKVWPENLYVALDTITYYQEKYRTNLTAAL